MLPFAALNGVLWFSRVAFQPWYADMPLVGFARWITAGFLAVMSFAIVAIPAIFIALYHCAE